jgi:phenylacetate-coenzyme A ligase PaaK-like adenylate-forming protein
VRSGDIVKIKGTLVNLQVLKDELDRFPNIEEYQIVVRPLDPNDEFSMDDLVIRLAGSGGPRGNRKCSDRKSNQARARASTDRVCRPRCDFQSVDRIKATPRGRLEKAGRQLSRVRPACDARLKGMNYASSY